MDQTRIFIRDDDVGDRTPALEAFAGLFAEREIPVSYQIIPELLTEAGADYMLGLRQANPALVEFGQHGLRHQMMLGGKRVYFEFGPQRSYDQQAADIRAGKTLLRHRLGDDSAARIFTPPRHRYDRNTLRALRAEGFSVLSSSSYTSLRHRLAYGMARRLGLTNLGPPGVPWHGQLRPDCGLFEVSIAVAVDNGTQEAGSADEILAQVAQARRHTSDVGLMFHHMVYKQPEQHAFLARVLDALTALPGVSFHTIGDICALSGRAEAAA
jgi:hypothetical protein